MIRFRSQLLPESVDPLPDNPFRGLYDMVQLRLSEGVPPIAPPPGRALVLLEAELSAFRAAPLSPGALAALREEFALLRSLHRQIIFRPVYDWDGSVFVHEPEDVSVVLTHVRQLEPLLRDYAEDLFLVQGVLLGAWGEMHSSRHLSTPNVRAILKAMAEVTDTRTFLAVRTPLWYRLCESDVDPARLAVFDDALLSSETDMGTFADPGTGSDSPFARQEAAQEKRFLGEKALRSPFGGETAAKDPLNDGPAFYKALDLLHPTYLNAAYHQAVLGGWRAGKVEERKHTYRGESWLTAIQARLGYRFVIADAKVKQSALRFDLRNTGCAPMLRPTSPFLLLRGTGGEASLPVPCDLSRLAECQELILPLGEVPKGEWTCSLRIPGVRLGNAPALAEDPGRIGLLTIK